MTRNRQERQADEAWAYDEGYRAFGFQWTTAGVSEWIAAHGDLAHPFILGMEASEFDCIREDLP